jgi:hypothetical protein
VNEGIEAGPNRVGLKHAVAMMLEADTIEHLDWLAKVLSNQRGQEMSRSEAVAFLVERNWMSVHKKLAARKHQRSVKKVFGPPVTA